MKKLMISGATGMIGSAIVRLALKQNYKICCIVRKNSTRIDHLPKDKNLTIVECNLRDYKSLKLTLKYDIFIHLAWDKTFGVSRDDVSMQINNIQYTFDAVNLAKRCGCSVFIGAGSQAEYGIKTEPLTPEMTVNPESGYGIAKFSAGKLARLLCKQLGIRFNWLRILSVYGKDDASHTLISYVISELKAGRSPKLTKCEQRWDYLFCDDVATAFFAVAENGIDGKSYPLGSGQAKKLSEYIEEIHTIINPSVPIKYGQKDYYPHQPMYLVANITQLTKDTNWSPKISFQDGIKNILGQNK
ncbi:MAG: NAD(P)-dependent oxidoreductase [Lentisphaeria bacterium]